MSVEVPKLSFSTSTDAQTPVIMVSVAGSAIEILCDRFHHRKRCQNIVGRTNGHTVCNYI